MSVSNKVSGIKGSFSLVAQTGDFWELRVPEKNLPVCPQSTLKGGTAVYEFMANAEKVARVSDILELTARTLGQVPQMVASAVLTELCGRNPVTYRFEPGN